MVETWYPRLEERTRPTIPGGITRTAAPRTAVATGSKGCPDATVAREEQVTGRRPDRRARVLEHHRSTRSVERSGFDSILTALGALAREQNLRRTRGHDRSILQDFVPCLIERDDLSRLSASRSFRRPQGAAAIEEDIAPLHPEDLSAQIAPGRDHRPLFVVERNTRDDGASRNEGDAPTVGREGHAVRPVGAGDLSGVWPIERSQEQGANAVADADHADSTAVGRQTEAALKFGDGLHVRRIRNLEVDDIEFRGRSRVKRSPRESGDRDCSDQPRCDRGEAARWSGGGDGRRTQLCAAFERHSRFADIAKPLLRIAIETAPDEIPHGGRRLRGERLPVGVAREDGGQYIAHRFTGKESFAGQHFEKHDAKRPYVRAFVDLPSARLLGAHVRRGAHDHSGVRCVPRHRWRMRDVARRAARPGLVVECLRETEVEDLDLSIGRDFHVRRLEVAMDDAVFVRFFKRVRDLARDCNRFVDGNRAALQSLRKVFTFDEFENERDDGGPWAWLR